MKGREMNVLLTGATGGIGRQTATLLATRGANLLLVARNESRLSELGVRAAGRARPPLVLCPGRRALG